MRRIIKRVSRMQIMTLWHNYPTLNALFVLKPSWELVDCVKTYSNGRHYPGCDGNERRDRGTRAIKPGLRAHERTLSAQSRDGSESARPIRASWDKLAADKDRGFWCKCKWYWYSKRQVKLVRPFGQCSNSDIIDWSEKITIDYR